MPETLRMHVTGMTCGGCENAVKRTLLKLEGVEAVAASHEQNAVTVVYEPARISPERMARAIQDLGYSAGLS
jgi:copper chaperone